MPPDLQFEPLTHTYTLAGRVLPSVTQILAALDTWLGPEDAVELARVRGEAVHVACDLIDRECLDWQSLDPALAPYVEGYRNWLTDSGATVVASEVRVASPALGYAGTADLVALVGKRVVLVDRKATAVMPATVGPQTAAYEQAAADTYHCYRVTRLRRACLHLHPSHARGYRFTALTDPSDWSVFLSCLNLFKWRAKHAA